jgi:hypothetical protein
MSLSDDKKKIIVSFIKFVRKEIGIKSLPSVIIKNNRDGLKTTASYNYSGDKKIITVTSKNRALVDIMRSIAHELVHHKQYEDGRLKTKPKDIGGDIEDESNAVAGQLIKKFAIIEKTIYDE